MKATHSLRAAAVILVVAVPFVGGTTAETATTASNPIVLENQQPGTTSWQFTNYNKAQAHEIEGYASLTSVNKGAPISFMVSLSSSAQYTMDFYRIGWYPTGTNADGSSCAPSCGGRLMSHVGPLNGVKQAACPQVTSSADPNFGMTECQWTPSYTLTDTTAWTTGTYIVKLTRLDGTHLENWMTFVVRDDASTASIVYSLDVNTWQAYNFWGGAGNNNLGINLYARFNDVSLLNVAGSRAYTVSFDRPYLDQGGIDGAGSLMVWDFPLIRWMESKGYDMSYITDVDLESNPNVLNGHRAFVNTGHDEYYSDGMRSRIQSGISSGVNMAFFGANNIYSRTTWGSNAGGDPLRRVHTDKGALPGSTTAEYRVLSPPQPENAINGVMQNGVATSRPFLVYDASNWIYAGSGLVNYTGSGTTGVVTSGPGQNALPGLIGYEFDTRAVNGPLLSSYTSSEPAGLQQVGHSFVPASDNGVNAWADATVYTAASGATVFSAGTIQWPFGVDDGYNDGFCSCNHAVANSAAQKITSNILDRFSSPPAAPSVTLTPSAVTFASQMTGTTSAAQTVTLTNSGGALLTIGGIALVGANPGDFVQTNTCPASLAAGGSCTVSVTFTPTAMGARAASVSITDSAVDSPQTVSLSGTGIAPGPAVGLTPSSLSFGSQLLNTSSEAQSTTLTSTGTAPLTISSVAITGLNLDDFAQTNTCPLAPSTLAPGATCTISVTFRPAATGARTAAVTINDDAAGSSQNVTVSGTGAQPAPAVSLAPSSLSFGGQLTGTTSGAQTVTLTNAGSAPLTISSVGIAGTNAGDFAQTGNCPSGPATLAVNATCTVSVTFTPTATGSRSASVSISDDAQNSPQAVPLTGTGIAPAVTLTPSSLAFGLQKVGTTSAPQTVTLTNSGGAPLTISNVAITGVNAGEFAQTSNCPVAPATLAASATCAISVTFTPGAVGSRSASVTVSDDAAGSPHTVPLTGSGGTTSIAFDKDLGSKGENTNGAKATLTTAAAAAVGSRVFVFVNWNNGSRTLSSVSGGGLTWTVDRQAKDTTNYHGAIASASAPLGLAAGTVITAAFSASVTRGLIAAASFTGIASSSPRDATGSSSQGGVATWSASVTTTNANDLVLGWSGIDANATRTSTATSPSLEIHDFGNASYGARATSVYQIESTTGANTVSGFWTAGTGATANVTVVAAYRAQ